MRALFPGPCKNLGPLFQGASVLAKVARMESLGKSPSIGESKSSIRKTAEATQDRADHNPKKNDRIARREQPEDSENDRQPGAHCEHERPCDRAVRCLEQPTPATQRLVGAQPTMQVQLLTRC
jgi:hypothetical protein